MRRRHQRHPAGDDFRQNLDPLQIALAHRYQSHPQSPRSSNPGSVTFQLCRNRTLQLCGYTPRPLIGNGFGTPTTANSLWADERETVAVGARWTSAIP
ncbi:hypothetical protein ELH46_37730 [Rhizobium ruizarguesonis]|nr:hypothetical protein ELH46_37730 [Rhizobium ruizarguesonis]